LKRWMVPVMIFFLLSCAEVYHGKYVDYRTGHKVIDEFKVGNLVVLALESGKKKPKTGEWIYRFVIFRSRYPVREMWLEANIVGGRRRYYLYDRTEEGKVVSRAQFPSKPAEYEFVKQRVIQILEPKED